MVLILSKLYQKCAVESHANYLPMTFQERPRSRCWSPSLLDQGCANRQLRKEWVLGYKVYTIVQGVESDLGGLFTIDREYSSQSKPSASQLEAPADGPMT